MLASTKEKVTYLVYYVKRVKQRDLIISAEIILFWTIISDNLNI